jgi:hypothetical protein
VGKVLLGYEGGGRSKAFRTSRHQRWRRYKRLRGLEGLGVTSSRIARGYESQRIVAEFFRENGFPYAQPAGSGRTGTDITGVIGVDVEVKARRGIQVSAAMKQLRDRQQDGLLPVAVLRLDGQGPSHIDDWPAIVPLSVLLDLLKAAGYDKPKFD